MIRYCCVGVLFLASCITGRRVSRFDSLYCPAVDPPSAPEQTSITLNTYELRQSDFADGTVRLTQPGVYKLMEDISFNPNNGTAKNWYPHCFGPGAQTLYCGAQGPSAPYRLGFFAAITIEGEDIHIDLNQHTLDQHEQHALQQRFYAHIELADQPFIPDQGPQPGGFGSTLNSCVRCSVKNGKLGRSSHHGIHGNNAHDLVVHDVVFEKYEVAAISCNGCKRVEIERVQALGSETQIPTRATYSAARFMMIFWAGIAPLLASDPTSAAAIDLSAKAAALQARMDQVYNDIIHNGGQIIDAENQRQFALPVVDGKRLVDGNAYGMTFHGEGVLVGPFTAEFFGENSDKISSDIRMIDTVISNTAGNVNEVIAMQHPDGGVNQDVAGGTVRMSEILEADGVTYKPDALHDFRFALGWWSAAAGGNYPALVSALQQKRLGTLKIDPALAQWAREGTPLPTTGFKCNIDSMHHAQKGVVGLFLQQVFRFEMERVTVENTLNQGGLGSEMCGNYWETSPGMYGYTGSQTRAVAIAGSKMLAFHDFHIKNVEAHYGAVYGIHAFNDVSKVCLNHGTVAGVTSGDKWVPPPNTQALVHYVAADGGVSDISSRSVAFLEDPDAVQAC